MDAPPDVIETTGGGLMELGMHVSAVLLETDLSATELLEHYEAALKQEGWHQNARGWCDAAQAQQFGCDEGAFTSWSGVGFDQPGVIVAYLSIKRLDGQQWLARYWEAIGGEIPSGEQGGDEGDTTPAPPPPIGDESPQPRGIREIPEEERPPSNQ